MTNLIKIAKAAPYQEVSDLYVDESNMKLYATNYWTGKLFNKTGSIEWSRYNILRKDIANDFFGFES